MSDYNDIKISSNRSFGVVFFIVFLLIALYPLLNNNEVRLWSLIISGLFLILGILNSKILSPLNKIWFKFGLLLGKIISPIVISLIYFTVFTLVRLIMILLGKKTLENTFDPKLDSYWVSRKDPPNSMERQF